MRREINLIESFLSEINMIPDFDDTLNAIRKDNTWGEMVAQSKTVGKIGSLTVLVYHSDFGDMYFLMDGKSPVGKATVSETTFPGFYKVGHIWFEPSYRGKGHGYALYDYLLDKGMKIVSDIDQTRFSRGVWSKLARNGYVHSFNQGKIGEIVTDTEPFYHEASSRMVAVKTLNEDVTVTIGGKTWKQGSGSFKYGSTVPPVSIPKIRTGTTSPYTSSSPSNSQSAKTALLALARKYLAPHNLTWLLDGPIRIESINNSGWYVGSTDIVTIHPNHMNIGTLLHELGHRFHYQCRNSDDFDTEVTSKFSYYYRTNARVFWRDYGFSDRYEFWADSFEYWIMDDMRGAVHGNWIKNMIQKHNRGTLHEDVSVNVDGKQFNVGNGSSFKYGGSGSTSPTERRTVVGPGTKPYTPGTGRILFSSALSEDQKEAFRDGLVEAKKILTAKGVGWLMNCTFSFGSNKAIATYSYGSDTVRMRWGQYDNSVTRICDTIIHELGHRFHYQCRDTHALNREIDAKYEYYMNSDHDAFMRSYGRKDRYEFWADCFNLWVTNRIHDYHQAVWVSDMIEKYNRY